jgi:hypothetical protein
MNDAQNETTEQTTQSMSDIAASITDNGTGSEEAAPAQESQAQQGEQTQFSSDNVSEMAEFLKSQSKQTEALSTELKNTQSQLNELVNGQRREAVNKDIKDAVKQINENAGGSEDMAEIFLEKQYRENPDFKKIWQARGENPEAYQKALKMLAPEWESMTQTITDPQVAENQRALLESQRTGGTVQETSMNDKLDNMSDAEFMNHMRRLQG